MANHVSSYIQFEEINEPAREKLKELSGRLREMEYGRKWFADLFVDGEDLKYEDVEQYAWTTEFIGPKWCYIEDCNFDDETPYMMCESAWSAPEEGLCLLLDELVKLDPNIVTTFTYEDEMPNFIGWSVYDGTDLYDGCEDDDEEIRDFIFSKHPHLKEHWDESNDEWATDENGDMTDESYAAEDEYRDIMYECISDMQGDGVRTTLECLRESRESSE